MTEDRIHIEKLVNTLEYEVEETYVSKNLFRKKKLELHTPSQKSPASDIKYSQKSLVDI